MKLFWLKISYPLILLLTLPCFSDPADKKLRSRTLDGRIGFFYLYHNSQRGCDILKEIADLEEFDDRYYFFVALLKTYPHQALEWMKKLQINPEQHNSLIYALWASGLKSEAIHKAQKATWPTKDLIELANHPKPVLECSPQQSGYLPCMNCHFFVTGDTRYINKMIDILDLAPKNVPPSFDLETLKKEAKYHLMQLMYHHELVYRLCLKESLSRSGEASRLLNELIEQFNILAKKGSLPEKNGMF